MECLEGNHFDKHKPESDAGEIGKRGCATTRRTGDRDKRRENKYHRKRRQKRERHPQNERPHFEERQRVPAKAVENRAKAVPPKELGEERSVIRGGSQVKRIAVDDTGIGTGGTITGVGSVLKQERSSVEVIAIEPASSPVLSGGEPGYHAIEGIGAGFVPDVVDEAVIDRVLTVSDADARSASRRLAAEEGLLVGISSGAACAAALRVASELGSGKTVLVIFPDSGERYLTTGLYSDNGH